MTGFARDTWNYFVLNLHMGRQFVFIISIVNAAFAVGLVLGLGYVVPAVDDATALFFITGTATQMVTTVSLVALPQNLSELKRDGRLDYFWTLPAAREAFIASLVLFVLVQAVPAIAVAVTFGAVRYDVALALDPWLLAAVPLSVLALGGVGITLAIISPHQQLTNAITQLVIFYVLFFAPVLVPNDRLPAALQAVGTLMPPSYVADAFRATLTDLPGTHLFRSLGMLSLFGAGSVALAAASVRRRS